MSDVFDKLGTPTPETMSYDLDEPEDYTHEYPSFGELEEYTGIKLDELIDPTSSNVAYQLARALTDFISNDHTIHGFYQIIFFCLDHGLGEVAKDFYDQMTKEGDDGVQLCDHTNAFVHYCAHNRLHGSLAFLLRHNMYDSSEPFPSGYIEKCFGINDLSR